MKSDSLTINKSIPLLLIVISCQLLIGQSHYIKKLVDPSSRITGYTNQSQEFFIPFKKCFKVVP